MQHARFALLLTGAVASFATAAAGGQALLAQGDPGATAPMAYARTEYYIPMRDGVKLDTVVYAPMDTRTDYPILLRRWIYHLARYPSALAFGVLPAAR